MQGADVVRAFHQGIEKGNWETVQACLAEDYIFRGPSVVPLGKRALISSQKALWSGFPDLRFNLRIVEERGNVVKGVVQITGTHRGLLIPPFPDKFMTIPPTGKKIALAEEPATYTLRGNQIVLQDVVPSPDGGWPGIFKQLGVVYPYPMVKG